MLFTEFNLEEAKEVWREEGFEEGFEEGREEGREEVMLKIANAMFNDGDSLDKIARNTGIQIEVLKEKLTVE